MNKTIKTIILVLTLGLPVAIYLFLQGFGENQYALPVFPEGPVTVEGCVAIEESYVVKKLTCGDLEVVVLGDGIDYLFHFPATSGEALSREMNEMRRAVEQTTEASFKLLTFTGEAQFDAWNELAEAQAGDKYWAVSMACGGDFGTMKNCQLLLPLAELKFPDTQSRLVLVDSRGRVRGFYVPSDREEIDRLMVELEILKQEK